jgi:hypothetical protein
MGGGKDGTHDGWTSTAFPLPLSTSTTTTLTHTPLRGRLRCRFMDVELFGCATRFKSQVSSSLLLINDIGLKARFCLPFSFEDSRQFAGVTGFRCVNWYTWSSGLTRRCHGERVRVRIYPSWTVCAFSSLVCKQLHLPSLKQDYRSQKFHLRWLIGSRKIFCLFLSRIA